MGNSVEHKNAEGKTITFSFLEGKLTTTSKNFDGIANSFINSHEILETRRRWRRKTKKRK